MPRVPKVLCKFNIPVKFSMTLFCRYRKIYLKIHMDSLGTLNTQNSLERAGQSWRIQTFWFQNLLESYDNQNSVTMA